MPVLVLIMQCIAFLFLFVMVFMAVKLKQEEKAFKKTASKKLRDSIRREADYENKNLKRQ